MGSVIYNINVFLSVYGIFLIVYGTIGNIISFLICLRPHLRKTPTFIFLAASMIVDTIALYFWNLNIYFLTFEGITIADFNIDSCRATSFLQGFSFQSSAWLLVVTALERYLSVKIRNWRNIYFKPKHAVITSLFIMIVIFAGNAYLIGTLPYSIKPNGTRFSVCYGTSQYKAWRAVHTYSYSIVPFIVLAIINIMLIHHVLRAKQIATATTTTNIHQRSKRRSMTISIVIFTLMFVCMTAPSAILGGYFLTQLIATLEGRVIIYSFGELSYSFHGINFFIFMLTNKKFSHEFRTIMKMCCNNRVRPEGGEDSLATTGYQPRTKKSTIYDD